MSATTTTKPKPPARRRGRPYKLTPETTNKLCKSIRQGVPFKYACALADIGLSSFFQWQSDFPKFKERILKARARGVQHRLKIIETAMNNGSAPAAQWWLEHCESEFFGRQAISLSGPDGGPLALAVGIYLPQKQGAPVQVITEKAPDEIAN